MLRFAWIVYFIIVAAMTTVSIVTGRRATAIASSPHYLLTRTTVFVEERTPPASDTEAALDALFEQAGEVPTRMVEKPAFVLGLLDATCPAAALGLLALAGATFLARRRRAAAGKP